MTAFNKPAVQALADLINASNPTSFTAATLGHGDPTPYAEADQKRNTTVSVWDLSTPAVTYTVHYNRLALSTLIPDSSSVAWNESFTSTHDLLPILNSTFNLALSTDDILDEVIDVESTTFLKSAAKSLVIYGNVSLIFTGLPDYGG